MCQDVVDIISYQVLTFVHPSDMAQFFVKTRRNMQKIKLDDLDYIDKEYIEFDILI